MLPKSFLQEISFRSGTIQGFTGSMTLPKLPFNASKVLGPKHISVVLLLPIIACRDLNCPIRPYIWPIKSIRIRRLKYRPLCIIQSIIKLAWPGAYFTKVGPTYDIVAGANRYSAHRRWTSLVHPMAPWMVPSLKSTTSPAFVAGWTMHSECDSPSIIPDGILKLLL